VPSTGAQNPTKVAPLVPTASPAEQQARILLDNAVAQLQQAKTFTMRITQSGQDYPLTITFDGILDLKATLDRAVAQVVNPDEMHIHTQLRMFLPLSLEVYSRGSAQWLSFPSGLPWIPLPGFEGFNIVELMAPDMGFEKVIAELRELQFLESAELDEPAVVDDAPSTEDEESHWHLQGLAAPDGVASVLFNFIEPQDDVLIHFQVRRDDGRFAHMDLTMLETELESGQEPARWHISFDAYDTPPRFKPPR